MKRKEDLEESVNSKAQEKQDADCSKIEIHQVDGKTGIFTEILIDGRKIHGVRSYELKQTPGNSIPTLTLDLNAFDLSTDMKVLQLQQKGIRGIKSITFDDGDECTFKV